MNKLTQKLNKKQKLLFEEVIIKNNLLKIYVCPYKVYFDTSGLDRVLINKR